MKISVRKAKISDLLCIKNMWTEFMAVHDRAVLPIEPLLKSQVKRKKESADIFISFARRCIYSKNAVIFVVLDDTKGIIVGYIQSFIKSNIPVFNIEKLGYISDLFIKKEYRGKGLSTQLKDRAISWFRKKGINDVSICVFPQNKHAYKVYKKWGFFEFHQELRIRI